MYNTRWAAYGPWKDIYDRTICFMYALQYGYSRYLVNRGTPCTQQNDPVVSTLIPVCCRTRASVKLIGSSSVHLRALFRWPPCVGSTNSARQSEWLTPSWSHVLMCHGNVPGNKHCNSQWLWNAMTDLWGTPKMSRSYTFRFVRTITG